MKKEEVILNELFSDNYFTEKELTERLYNTLIKNGIKELTKESSVFDDFISIKNALKPLDKTSDDLNGFFVHQPHGSQKSPDIILFIDNKAFFIEMKSSKTDNPMFNSHIPTPSIIYLLSLKNKTFPIIGSDIIDYDTYEYYNFLWKYDQSDNDNIGGYKNYDRKMIISCYTKDTFGNFSSKREINFENLNKCKIIKYKEIRDDEIFEYLSSKRGKSHLLIDKINQHSQRNNKYKNYIN